MDHLAAERPPLAAPGWPEGLARPWTWWLAWTCCGLVLAMLMPILLLVVANRHAPDLWRIVSPVQMLTGLIYSVVGALLASRGAGRAIGWVFLATGLVAQTSALLNLWAVFALLTHPGTPAGAHALWLGLAAGAFGFSLFPLLLFPSGRLPDRRSFALAWLVGLLDTLLVLFLLTGNTYPPGFSDIYERVPNPMALSHPLGDPGLIILALGICLVLAIALLLGRFRRSSGLERQQYKWVVLEMFLVVVAFVGDFLARGFIQRSILFNITGPLLDLSIALIPVAMGVAILRYHLWDVDVVISRTLVYLTLTVCVAGIYVLVVGWFSTRLRGSDDLLASLVATGIIAVLFQPLRERIQRQVNRRLFGERDEPYAAISRLGRRLEATFAPQAVLPVIAATVRESLKLPYAAIVIDEARGQRLTAESGTSIPDPVRLPLSYQGDPVGELLMAPRARGEAFSLADRHLLEDLARQAGIAVHAVRLTRELQRARERLVETREEERRRLRRDLHDGLGSQLVALHLQWGALPSLIAHDQAAAQAEVAELRGQLRQAIASVRTLVHDLRPPSLDELGLLVSLRERARQFGADNLVVESDLPETLPSLPAAVEVAVYRIAEEALTNVAKHARAHRCRLRLTRDDGLTLVVEDDGIGIAPDAPAGVGLRSMRERAEELGGRFSLGPRPGGGTRLVIHLPVGQEYT
ncbi:MAG TPA: histidine kinase [Thermomicrobiaceae bacterium]|nr:histidine kinase [Thermomicrobiaceae bacterium]